MGLWGIHTERAIQHYQMTCVDGVNKVLVGFCLQCEFWITNDSALNNHVHNHYKMGMSCYHNGYTMGSMASMETHMCITHKILIESAPKKCKRRK